MYAIDVRLLLIGFTLVLSCETDMSIEMLGEDKRFPDFSECECDFDSTEEVVCDSNGNWFRSPCFASCIGNEGPYLAPEECNDTLFNSLDTLTWPIHLVCHPVQPFPPLVHRLSDSTFIFQTDSNTFIRGIPFPFCRCLPSDTRITRVDGDAPISQLEVGDSVFTKNSIGQMVLRPIIQKSKVPTSETHKLLHMELADGRRLSATPGHPDELGNPLELLKVGDQLDGGMIVTIQLLRYEDSFTWDILPGGETGVYLANGVWVGSTLSQDLPIYIP